MPDIGTKKAEGGFISSPEFREYLAWTDGRMDGQVWGRALRYLSHFLKVFVPLLEGSRSVQGLPHACVLAEKGLAVVLDPVQHLRAKIRKAVTTPSGKRRPRGGAPYSKRTRVVGVRVNDGGKRRLNRNKKTACVTGRRAFCFFYADLTATLSFRGLNEWTASAWTYDLVR